MRKCHAASTTNMPLTAIASQVVVMSSGPCLWRTGEAPALRSQCICQSVSAPLSRQRKHGRFEMARRSHQFQRHEHAVRIFAVATERPAAREAEALVELLRRAEGVGRAGLQAQALVPAF